MKRLDGRKKQKLKAAAMMNAARVRKWRSLHPEEAKAQRLRGYANTLRRAGWNINEPEAPRGGGDHADKR